MCDSVMMACHDMHLQFNSCTEHAFLVFNDTRGVQVRAQPSSLFRLRQKKYKWDGIAQLSGKPQGNRHMQAQRCK